MLPFSPKRLRCFAQGLLNSLETQQLLQIPLSTLNPRRAGVRLISASSKSSPEDFVLLSYCKGFNVYQYCVPAFLTYVYIYIYSILWLQ